MSAPAPLRAVVAIGGNALLRPSDSGVPEDLRERASEVAGGLIPLLRSGHRLLLVHGNGPQVGVELIRSEEASTKVAPFTLDLCVASTQGTIAALLEVALRNALFEEGLAHIPVASLLSLVTVDGRDAAFQHPTKPIGLHFTPWRARELERDLRARGWDIVEDAGRGYRAVVPSPTPLALPAAQPASLLLDAGFVVIAGGGGGVPVSTDSAGRLRAAEAVIDKDRTAVLAAQAVRADLLIFLTGAPSVELNYGTPFARRLDVLPAAEARRHLAMGQFPPGSMGPKVEAAIAFAEAGGTALITSADTLAAALKGNTGTRITPNPESP